MPRPLRSCVAAARARVASSLGAVLERVDPSAAPYFPPYPGFPTDPERLDEARRRIAAIPRGIDYFDVLERDPVMVAVFKTDTVRRALASNAEEGPEERRPVEEVIGFEEWVFSTYAGI